MVQEHYLQIMDAHFEQAAQFDVRSQPRKRLDNPGQPKMAESENHSKKQGNPAPLEIAGVGGWEQQDSNLRPRVYETPALTAELCSRHSESIE